MPKLAEKTAVIDKHIGFRVRTRRMQLGKSQEQLADTLGLTFQQVQKYENGKNRIGAGTLVLIARALQVSPMYFFEGAPAPANGGGNGDTKILDARHGAPDPLPAMLAHRDGLALATAFNAIGDHATRAVVVRMAQIAAGKEARS